MSRLKTISSAKTHRRGPRGFARQSQSRLADRTAMCTVLRTLRWLTGRGYSLVEVADRLGLTDRTVRRWLRRWEETRLAPPARGRPVENSGRETRKDILALFDRVGPEISIRQLMEEFPDASRAELIELKQEHRARWRRKEAYDILALSWLEPGRVWAMDFTQPPRPIDGLFPKVLVTRDLPSANQLQTLPVSGEKGKEAADALLALIREHGAPLVVKVDNGPGFRSKPFRKVLEKHGILPLFSPAWTPTYNGAVETGNGTLKTHAHHESARNNRPGEWTCDDVEAARLRGNAYGRPHGEFGPTPDQAFARKVEVTEEERSHFQKAYREEHNRVCEEWKIPLLTGPEKKDKDKVDRRAIGRALVRCGYLMYRRRRITPPVSPRKADRIT